MAKLLKLRRGTTSQHSSFTGAEGEVTVDTDKEVVVVHDGSTAGGTPLATEASVTAKQAADAELTELATMASGTASALADLTQTEVEILDGATVTTAELNILDGVTATAAELNILDGVTSTAAELNTLDGFTGDKDDLNYAKDLKATGVTATEFDYLDGVTSAIQTQIDTKAPLASPTFTGTVAIPNIANLETAVAANTAKVTNATHTGDVTGSGALTIAADSVDGSKLTDNIDIAGTLDVTSTATFDSTGTFAGTLNSDGLLKINSAGTISGSSNMIQAYDESANQTFSLTAAGSATFTGNITATGASSYIGAYQIYTGNPAVGTGTAIGTDMIAGAGGAQFTSKSSSANATTAIAWRGYHGTTQTSKITAGGDATFAGTVTVQSRAVGEIEALTDASTIAVDFSKGNNYSVTLAGNRTLGQPTNQVAGQSGSIFVTQDGTGSRTLTYHADWKWAGGSAPTLSTDANTVDRIDYIVAAANKIHAVASLAVA